ncbi:MAG: CYTH domain-containing protein [Candidatus Nanoarchaeia archaeon]|nr:CYTH domain-containing protein [Candidatus Nanoarchaeia archaeon]
MNEYMNEAKKANLENESKYFVENLEALTNELQKITGKGYTMQMMTDTYYFSESMPKNSTLRIREVNGVYTPTLKIPIYDNKGLKKRLELESLEEISLNLGINLANINDIDYFFKKQLVIKQERNIIEYLGVEFSVDNVFYYNLNNELFYSAKIFEAELKSQQGTITRNGVLKHVKDKKLIKNPCTLDKYKLGLKNMSKI